MTTAVVDSPEYEQMDTAIVEVSLAVRPAPLLDEDVRPKSRPRHLVARWVRDPRREQDLICTWSASDRGGRLGSQPLSVTPGLGF